MKKQQNIQLMNGFYLQLNFGHSHQHLRTLLTFKLCNNLEKMKKFKQKLINWYKNIMKIYGILKQKSLLKIF